MKRDSPLRNGANINAQWNTPMDHCPYQDKECLIPPCDVTVHPDDARLEYCRVCRVRWEVGQTADESSHEILPLLAILIALMLGISLFGNRPISSPPQVAPVRSFSNPIEEEPPGLNNSDRLFLNLQQ